MEEKTKSRISTRTKVLFAIAIAAAFLVLQFFLWPLLGFGSERNMVIVSTEREIDYNFDSGALFHSNDNGFYYFVSRDGVRMISSAKTLMWSEPLLFQNPWMQARGEWIAVGELRHGRNLFIFNGLGLAYTVETDAPIISFNINETGFVSVITMDERGGFRIRVYNRYRHRHDEYLFSQIIVDDLIFPTHAEVSPCGTYVVIALQDLNFQGYARVQFRYMNQWDAWGTDMGHFATENFPRQSVTALRFMEGNRLVVATTQQIVGFRLGPAHSASREIWQIPLDNELTHIAFGGDSHFAIAKGSRRMLAATEGYAVGTVLIYGINGQQTGSFELGRRTTHLRMGHNAVIVGGDRSFHAVNLQGRHIWEHTVGFDTRDVLFLENTNTFLAAGAVHAEIFERRRIREGEEQ